MLLSEREVVQVKINIKREKYCSRRVYTNSRDIAMRGARYREISTGGAFYCPLSERASEREGITWKYPLLDGNLFKLDSYIGVQVQGKQLCAVIWRPLYVHCDTIQPLLAADNEITRYRKKCRDVSALQIGKQVEIFMLVLFLVSRGTRLASLSGCSENFKLILSGVS
jgi:hypothetical protein